MERLARSARESSRNCVRAWTLLGVPANRLSSPTRAAGSRVACRAADRQAAMMVGAPRKSRRGAVVMASLDSVVRPRSSLSMSGQCSRHRTLFRPQTQPQSQSQHTLRTPDPAQTQTQIQTRHTLPRTQCAEDVRQRGVGRRGGLGVAELATSENAGAAGVSRSSAGATSWDVLAQLGICCTGRSSGASSGSVSRKGVGDERGIFAELASRRAPAVSPRRPELRLELPPIRQPVLGVPRRSSSPLNPEHMTGRLPTLARPQQDRRPISGHIRDMLQSWHTSRNKKPRGSGFLSGPWSGPWRTRTSNLGIKSCPFAGHLPQIRAFRF
jgi:hypothetical protein